MDRRRKESFPHLIYNNRHRNNHKSYNHNHNILEQGNHSLLKVPLYNGDSIPCLEITIQINLLHLHLKSPINNLLADDIEKVVHSLARRLSFDDPIWSNDDSIVIWGYDHKASSISTDEAISSNEVASAKVVLYNKIPIGVEDMIFDKNGDHDLTFPYVGVEQWITSLNLEVEAPWKPFYVDSQVGG
ncbi:hypothetical protein E3N88_00863 [Mikania micrantha]|uniref:Uncharacterized protein n=1 Tax=Mikania micrantha TaxID=192012 RepID=A0A5N6Q0R6_9ASTR|nr:hypothetical protein E3N88_00863 [Mikania micrantha]